MWGNQFPQVPEPSDAERAEWERKLRRFHNAAGHPNNRNLARLIKDAGKAKWQVEMALDYDCPHCKALRPGGPSSKQVPPLSMRPAPNAWSQIVADVGEFTSVPHRCKLKFVLFVDAATHFRVAEPLKRMNVTEMKQESTQEVIDAFSRRWLADKPKPEIIIPDNGTAFTSKAFSDFCSSVNIWAAPPAETESWAHGLAESTIQEVKETMGRIQTGSPELSPETCLYLATGALNQTSFVKGYSSYQWVYGKDFSFTEEDEVTLAQLRDEAPHAEFAKLVAKRKEAEDSARLTRARRVMSRLQNSISRQPLRTFTPTEMVKIWRRALPHELYKGKRGGHRQAGKAQWIGPGRVVFCETLPHQADDDPVRHIVWVVVAGRLYRCSAHSVRPVTDVERSWYHLTSGEDPSQWKSLQDVVPSREYEDLGDQLPPGELEGDRLPELPVEPGEETYIPQRRYRLRGKQPRVRPYEPQPGSNSEHEEVNDYSYDFPDGVPDMAGDSLGTSEPSGIKRTAEEEIAHDTEDEAEPSTPKRNKVDSLEQLMHMCLQESDEGYIMEVELELTSNRQRKKFMRSPAVYLVSKLRDCEVRYDKLSSEHKVLFTRAKTKEVSSFLKQEAVRKCKSYEEEQLGKSSGRLMRCRWVLTWKDIPPEEQTDAQQEAANDPASTATPDGTRKAKARIVLLGYEHPDLLKSGFNSSAPVQTLLTRCLTYQLAVQNGWELEGLDLSTAFLQTSKKEEMDLWTTGVPELRQALEVNDDAILKILKDFYGSTTAPRGLWQDLDKTFQGLGAYKIISDPCVWIWVEAVENPRNDQDRFRTIGFMGGHVDDFHRAGDLTNEAWCKVRQLTNEAYKWGQVKSNSYRHAGTDLEMKENAIDGRYLEVHQDSYIETLSDLQIAKNDKVDDNVPLTAGEISQCRGALGAVQWLAVQTQPQICARCNLYLSDLSNGPTMKVARDIQSLISEVRQNPCRLFFKKLPGVHHWQDVRVITLGDQAHQNRPKGASTGGLITFLGGPGHDKGEPGLLVMVSWRTWKLQRVAIGTTDAEVQAMVESEDANFRTRFLWAELNGATVERSADFLATALAVVRSVPGVVGTDSKGGYDAVTRHEGANLGLSNARAAIQGHQVKESIQQAGTRLIWLSGEWNISDALTKKSPECRRTFEQYLKTRVWMLHFDPNFVISAKKARQQGKSAVQTMRKVMKPSTAKKDFRPVRVHSFKG